MCVCVRVVQPSGMQGAVRGVAFPERHIGGVAQAWSRSRLPPGEMAREGLSCRRELTWGDVTDDTSAHHERNRRSGLKAFVTRERGGC